MMPLKRWDILVELLKNVPHKIGAEIGVFEGDTTIRLLSKLPNLERLICVDPFEHYPEHTKTLNPNKAKFHDADFNKVFKTFSDRVKQYGEGKDVQIYTMYSVEASNKIADRSLDFAFIDANHSYNYVYMDIMSWLPKIKIGGLLTGHDYKVRGHRGNFGVTKAVHDIFGDNFESVRYVWYHRVGT